MILSEAARFCPICGCKLHRDPSYDGTGERLLCDRHGEMKVYLSRDPRVSAEVSEHCDKIGVVDVEA